MALGLVGASKLGHSDSPLAEAMGVAGNTLAVYTVSVGGLIATVSVLLTAILGFPAWHMPWQGEKICPKP